MKLRTHLILLTLATVVPVVLFAVGLIVHHTRLERSSLERGMRDTARALALALDRDINDIKTGVETLAASRHLEAGGDLARFYEEAATVSKGFGGWAVLSDPSGRQVLNTSRPFGAVLPLPTPSSLAMMKNVAASGRTFVSNVFIGTVSRQPAVIVAAPVIRDGQVRYVLDFPFPPTQFTDLLQEAALSQGWIAVITDRDGGVIARAPGAAAFVGRRERPAWTEQTAGSAEGFLRSEMLAEGSVYAAYKRSRETGWVVGVAAPVALIDAGLRRSLLALSGGGALLLAIACSLAFVLGKRIAAPLAALADSLKARPAAAPPVAPSAVAEVEDLRRALEDARTAERRAEQAHAAREEAEAANRAKDDFLAVLSHELRTPLNATFGWVRLLRSGRLDAGATARALDVIERSVSQQGRLISDLLDASRIIFGRLELSLQRVDMAALVAGVVESVRPSAEARAITLTSELDADAPVSGDPSRLRQVAENILGNALKFTPPGGTVTVRLVREDDARLVVSDTGPGIDAEFLPHIFERFRQSDSTSTRTHAGLGLGLAIVRHLVELHGGRVSAESAGAGRGATFTVVLPIAATAAGDGTAVDGHVAGTRAGERIDGLTVLVVEDDADTRDLLATILAQYGAVPITAASARAGVSTARRVRPDVLVCDLAMPDEDGFAVVRRVKSWAAAAGVPLPALALTAYARAEDREKALAAGFDHYMVKPVEPSELVRAVARLAGR